MHSYHKQKVVTNSPLSFTFLPLYPCPERDINSNENPSREYRPGVTQVHFTHELDVSQLQSGSNLSTFMQCCMQIYKPCLSMLMFPMMFTRGFATVIYFIWNALRCNGDELQYKTLWERVTECETEMRMRIKAFLLHSSQFEIPNPEILWTMVLNYSQQFKRNRFLTWASWCVVPKGQKHWIWFKCVSWDWRETTHSEVVWEMTTSPFNTSFCHKANLL